MSTETHSICTVCNSDIAAINGYGKRVCPVCGGYTFREVTINRAEATCSYCGKKGSESKYKKLPFYNAQNNTFYCGCRGWD